MLMKTDENKDRNGYPSDLGKYLSTIVKTI